MENGTATVDATEADKAALLQQQEDAMVEGLDQVGGAMRKVGIAVEAVDVTPTKDKAPGKGKEDADADAAPSDGAKGKVADDADADDPPVMYKFICESVDPVIPDPNIFDSDWQSSSVYTIVNDPCDPCAPVLTIGSTYAFTVKVKDALDVETTIMSAISYVTIGESQAHVLTVPQPYATIQDAIDFKGDKKGQKGSLRQFIKDNPENANEIPAQLIIYVPFSRPPEKAISNPAETIRRGAILIIVSTMPMALPIPWIKSCP